MMRTLATAVVATLLLCCGPSSTGTKDPDSIEVPPANATLTMGSTGGAPIDYVAIGHFADGHTEMLPDATFALDGAIMPTTALAPDVQWEGPANTGDLFRVRIVAGLATVDTILAVTPGFTLDALPVQADWQLLTASAHGQPINVYVDHWDATSGAQRGNGVAVKAINAQVTGVIYYWDLSQGQMQRIDGAGRALAIPNPPPLSNVTNNPLAATTHCVACHVVSRAGRYLAGELWGGGSQGAGFAFTI